MPKTAAPALQTFVDGWENYNRLILDALRPLTPEQLALKPAPHQWAIWQLAAHMAGARMFWFHDWMHEGSPALRDMFRVETTTIPGLAIEDAGWEDDENHPRTAAELVDGLEQTWALMAECLGRWTADELPVTFDRMHRSGVMETERRDWIIWHLIEHDLHHGGEISNILGSHGLAAPPL